MGRRKTACRLCASIKSACDRGRPCARCTRLCLTCIYDGINSIRSDLPTTRRKPSDTSALPTLPSGLAAIQRSRLGCKACHARHKKCDEQQPTCGDCQRLGRRCMPRSPTAKALDADQSPSSIDQVSSPGVPTRTPPSTSSAGEPPDWITLIQRESLAHANSHASGLAFSSALVDDAVIPVPEEGDRYVTFILPSAMGKLCGVGQQDLASWAIAHRHLLNHFILAVSRSLVVVHDDDNPFLVLVVPKALESDVVKRGLLALAACHLGIVYPQFRHDHRTHRAALLQHMRECADGVRRWNEGFQVTHLLAMLLLTLAEICHGTSRAWHACLHGCRVILDRVGDTLAFPDPASEFIVQLYSYLRHIACVTSEKTVLAHPLEWTMPVLAPAVLHPLLGMAAPLYQLLPMITHVSLQQRCGNLTGSSPPVVPGGVEGESQADSGWLSHEDLDLALRGWSSPASPSDEEYHPYRHLAYEAEAVGLATQWATLLLLNEVPWSVPPGHEPDPRAATAVANILSALSFVRPGSQMEARMLFPLFMAGLSSWTKTNRLMVEYRLNVMEKTVGFGHVATAHTLLQDIWRRQNAGEGIDWRLLMRLNHPGLVLF